MTTGECGFNDGSFEVGDRDLTRPPVDVETGVWTGEDDFGAELPASPGGFEATRNPLSVRENPTSKFRDPDDDRLDPLSSDAVEIALADAITKATMDRRWDVVAQLARDLEARRLARANVVDISVARRAGK